MVRVGSHGNSGHSTVRRVSDQPRAFLELHHVEPYAVGGAATVENIELRCRAHNAYEARLFFGPDVVREGERGGLDSFRNELTAFFRTVHQLIVGSGSV